jgi:hypothetical protein
MKTRNAIVLCVVVLFAVAGFAQQNMTVSLFTGYTMTAFENQESAAGTIPLGVSIGFKAAPALEIGGEFFYPLGGYEFKVEDMYSSESYTVTHNQMMAGAYGKYCLGEGSMKPFLKAGVGYYFGNSKSELGGQSFTADVDGAIGFNVGGGIQMESGLFAGFIYNIVNRGSGDEKSGANTWALTIGYQIIK